MPAGRNRTRLRLAHWLVSPDNPLTSRVAVNRIWQEVFGRGIVYTCEDFGTQGDRPTHPELLDWLASEYMQRGWSMKQMLRLMVTSATYRQILERAAGADGEGSRRTRCSPASRGCACRRS